MISSGPSALTFDLQELLNGDASDPGLSNADIIGTLGLRRPFQAGGKHVKLFKKDTYLVAQAMAYAALDLPADDMKHVDAVASIAPALAPLCLSLTVPETEADWSFNANHPLIRF